MNELKWSKQKANDWFKQKPWVVGCNFIPSNAINQLEMWQAATFDPETIQRELGWAHHIGFNTVRVYLHDLLWLQDAAGFKDRIHRYLDIATRQQIQTLFVIFDDCWNAEFATGKQPDPIPGVHNSGWAQSPGRKVVNDPSTWGRLEDYVHDILTHFGTDERILLWDLYNEPGNEKQHEKSLGLLAAVFRWAWEVRPNQPLSVGTWYDNKTLSDFSLDASDVITFHNYTDADSLKKQIAELTAHGRPMICTEYMCRKSSSLFQTHLPIFKEYGVGCINWGLVSGKTQTIYPWGSPQGSPEPSLWFHDVLRKDGSPYIPEEVEFIKHITQGLSILFPPLLKEKNIIIER